MRIKSILFMLVCFLLFGLAMSAIACPPPDCGDCCHWVSTGPDPEDGYCTLNTGAECGDCQGGCYNPCNNCVSCSCVWDCTPTQFCCNDTCCNAGQNCCGGSCCSNTCCNNVCCSAGQICCNNTCCDPDDCCNNEICCNSGDTCCTDSGAGDAYCCAGGKTCCDKACCDPATEKCCDDIGGDDDGYCCGSDKTCCDGTCCSTSTQKCCNDIGGVNDGYCCPDDHICCQGTCCDPDACEECDGNGNCVDNGCDCTIGGDWTVMPLGSVNDNCNNTLTLTFNNNVYCYYYNGLKIGNCPYLGGENTIGYWKTFNVKRFYATYHKSMDDKNDGSFFDEGTKYEYDSVVWSYDCISASGSPDKEGIEHPYIKGGDDGDGSDFEELYCPPL